MSSDTAMREYSKTPALCPQTALSMAGGLIERYDRGAWRDRIVNKMLTLVGLPLDAPWGAPFIQYVGHWSQYIHATNRSLWPFPMSATRCEDLFLHAMERNALAEEPEEGDIALLMDRATGEYLQGGFVLDVHKNRDAFGAAIDYHCLVIEGDTDHQGTPGAGGVCRVKRVLAAKRGDCFIRWTKLDHRGATADPMVVTEVEMGRTRVKVAS